MGTPKGGYFSAAGEKVPSVTTILSRFKDSGGLMFWAYKTGREHEAATWKNRICKWALKLIDLDLPWTKLIGTPKIAAMKLGTWEPEPECERLYDVSAKAAESGTLAHDAIEWFIKAQADHPVRQDGPRAEVYAWPDDIEPTTLTHAKNAYEQFQLWFHQNNIEILETETGSMSETYKFGGTLDGLGKNAAGDYVLLDWKTSNAIYADYLLQLAAYAILLEENFGIVVKEYHIVRVAKESADFNHASFKDLEHEKRTFLAMRELYDMVAVTAKRVR
jgi:hypothetical protein